MPITDHVIAVSSSAGVTVRNRWQRHEEPASDQLLVMLPGRNYPCEAPLFWYLQQMALRRGYDVLSVSYGFWRAGKELDWDAVAAEAAEAIRQATAAGYRHVCFAGKSLGSPLARKFARETTGTEISLLLLTPLPQALQPAEGVRALAVIGTEDPVFAMPECQEARERADMEWLVLDRLDHGLNHPDGWEASMKALAQVIEACERFLTGLA